MKTNNKGRRPGQLILLLVFLTTLALPSSLLFLDPGRELFGENRMATPLPKIVTDKGKLVTRVEIEDFVNDNIGFRTAAPRFDDMVMYTLFGAILDTAQLQGKNGNLFAGDDRRFPSRRAPYPPLSEQELTENGAGIQAASDYFKSKDIPFIFITIPNKEEIYPELYPDAFVKRPDQNRLAQQVEWLLENTDVDAYDMTAALREEARSFDGMLWYETKDSAHWNDMGAWYGYREIIERLKAYDPELPTLNINDFVITDYTVPFVNWDKSFTYDGLYNTMYRFDYIPGFGCEQISNKNDPWMPKDQLKIAGFHTGGKYYHFYNSEREGTLVFFGDSYIYQFLLPHFSESFRHVYLFHLPTNYTIMKPVLEMIGADYVVLEMVERTYGTTNIDTMAAEFLAEAPVLIRPEDYPE